MAIYRQYLCAELQDSVKSLEYTRTLAAGRGLGMIEFIPTVFPPPYSAVIFQRTHLNDMSRWLASGIRRDICILLYQHESPTGQSLKRSLETHYESSLSPTEFYGAVTALVEQGFVDRRPDGVHDAYTLTPAGETALLEHVTWVSELIDME